MRPILYPETGGNYGTNGLGRLEPISCKVTEERNGMYELEAVVSEGSAHYSEISMSKIILAPPSEGKSPEPFRIYKITKPINGKSTVYAQHLSYWLSYIPTMPFSVLASSTACNETLQGLKQNAAETCPFDFWTDVTTVAPYTQTVPSSIRQQLGGIEGSVLDQFGGEYEFSFYHVKLHKNRGITVPTVTLRYGKNITDITQEEYISNTITGVCPYWRSADGQLVTLPEKVIESTYADNYPFRRTVSLDLSENWQDPPTVAQLRAAATAAVQKDGIGIPTVSIKVSFVALWQTEEYKDVAPLQSVKLCDTVKVEFEKLGIDTTAKVVKTVYDVLNERYESIEIGSVKTSLAQAISDTNGAITAVAERQYIDIQNATAWLTSSNGYVVAVRNNDGSWKELLFMDTNDTATAHNVLRINENGIGFSSTGVSGPFTQAWTLDGKMVIGGTNVPSLTVYDNSNNILFQVSKNGVVWNVANSSMAADGTLTASNAVLTGSITVKSGSTTLFSATPTGGVVWTATNSSMDSTGKITASSAVLNSATINNSTVTGSLEVKDPMNRDIFKAAPGYGVSWWAPYSSMDYTGVLNAQIANLSNAVISGGEITQVGSDSWLKIKDGSIRGGAGTTVGVNQCSLIFNQLINSQPNVICMRGGTIELKADKIGVTDSESGTVVHICPDDDTVITSLTRETITYISNLQMSGGSATWDIITKTVVTGYTYRSVKKGLVI